MASDALRELLIAPRLPPGRWRTMLMRYYRQKLFEAAYALVAAGDLNMRLSHVASILIQIDDEDVPATALATFEWVRDPLIAKPLVIKGEMLPRDLDPLEGRALAQAVLDLLVAEVGEA